MISDSDREWLKALDESLWPKTHKNGVVSLEPSRKLTEEELERLTALLESKTCVLEFISTNMFGGYGIRLYEHEGYPGTGPSYLTCIIEGHLPPEKTRFERDVDAPAAPKDRTSGSGSTRAWNYFSPYSHTDEMKAFCKAYRLDAPRERSYYDY